jgi:chromosome segregation protein
VTRERQRQLVERAEETEANLVPLRTALTSERLELEVLQAELVAAGTELQGAKERQSRASEAHEHLAHQRHAALRRQAEAQARALELRHQLGDREVRLSQTEERLSGTATQLSELNAQVGAGTERRRAQQEVVALARRELDEAEELSRKAQADEAEADGNLAAARTESERIQKQLGQHRMELQRASVRLEALDRLHADGAGLYAGVRAVMQAAGGELPGLPGPVSALLRVPADLERAIEAALGSQLQDVVANTWDDAQRAIDWLKTRRAGRATFLPLDTLRPAPVLELPRREGIVGLASGLVAFDDAYAPAVLLLLGRTAIVETLDAARRLLHDLRGSFHIVTLAGEIVRSSGSVTGGEGREAQGPGLLSRERERRDLRSQALVLSQSVSDDERVLAAIEANVRSLSALREAFVQKRRNSEERVRELDRALDLAVRDLERVLQETQWQHGQLEQLTEERERSAAQAERLRSACEQAKNALAAAEALVAQCDAELVALSDGEAARVLAERRTEVAVLEQELESRRVFVGSRQREVARLERQIAAQEQRLGSLRTDLESLNAALDTLDTTYSQVRDEADGLAAQIPPLETELGALEAALESLAEREQGLRRVLREAEQRLAQTEVDANRREDQLQTLKREIEESLGIVISNLPDSISTQQPLPLGDIVCPLPTVTELPHGLENQVRDLRTQIRRLEPINPAAKEEYDELAARHRFLREQMDDLERASAHLHEIIGELDEMMETMFSTTFKSVAAEFARVFELLFSGGSARLELAEGEDGRLGVEILARPPGKRTASLAMLSGGERSLTAVALIFAVMSVSPTPFCVLDEVDAMLDEANVGRFRRMLRDLARETQFVIITHNRGTVEVADTIYGVSMGDGGVSEVLSLNLEDMPVSEAI